jgi:hypothetical protein
MRILVIANKKPELNMRHIVEDLHVSAVITLGNLQLEDIIMLPHVGDIPKVGIYGPDDSNYMDQLGISDVSDAVADVYGEIVSGLSAAQKSKETVSMLLLQQKPDTFDQLVQSYHPKIIMYPVTDDGSTQDDIVNGTRLVGVVDSIIVTI